MLVVSQFMSHFWSMDSFWIVQETGNLAIASLGNVAHHSLIFAQDFSQIDLMADLQSAANSFVKSGQMWAFLIGLVLGFVSRSMLTY